MESEGQSRAEIFAEIRNAILMQITTVSCSCFQRIAQDKTIERLISMAYEFADECCRLQQGMMKKATGLGVWTAKILRTASHLIGPWLEAQSVGSCVSQTVLRPAIVLVL